MDQPQARPAHAGLSRIRKIFSCTAAPALLLGLLLFPLQVCADSLTIYLTWNIQGEIISPDQGFTGGLEQWAALAGLTKKTSSIHIDMGNTLFPGFLSRFSYGSLTNEILALTGCEAKAVTLRDFHKGREQLVKLGKHARFPYIAVNIVDRTSRQPLFSPRYIKNFGQTRVALYSVAAPGDHWEVRNWEQEKLEVLDPVSALRSAVAAGRDTPGPVFSICVCEKRVIDTHPAIISIKGIDLFVVGVPAFSSGLQKVEEIFTDGKRVVYVPEIKTGVGRLAISPGQPQKTDYRVVSLDSIPPDSLASAKIDRLVEKWHAMYTRENSSEIAAMDSALTRGHLQVVGDLLREWSGCELAGIEQNLVNCYNLPAGISAMDLDGLLSSSPDLMKGRLTGEEIARLQRARGVAVIGIDKGRIAGRPIRRQESYSIILTENAYRLLVLESGQSGVSREPVSLRLSVFDVLSRQLSRRRQRTYDFAHLDRRWRFLVESATELSVRRVAVGNPDSIRNLSGVTYNPFSAWNINARVPMTIYNGNHRIDLQPRLEYAATNGVTGRNLLDLRLHYVFGTFPSINPYASAGYQSYLTIGPGERKPVRLRTSLGAETAPGEWKFKVGFGAEKSGVSSQTNPLLPLPELIRDTSSWGPGIELSAGGTIGIDAMLRKRKVNLAPYQELKLEIQADNFFVERDKSLRAENRLSVDLIAAPTARLRFKTGFRTYYAYLFSDRRYFYNLEPSLSILGTYHLKW